MSDNVHEMGTAVQRQQKLQASVLRSCKNCGAPGYWHDVDPNINPGCYAPDKVTTLGNDPVGRVCPNCGADRPDPEYLGTIWSRTWRASLWPVLKDTLRDLITPAKWRRQ